MSGVAGDIVRAAAQPCPYPANGSACLTAAVHMGKKARLYIWSARDDWPALIIPGDTGVLPDPSELDFCQKRIITREDKITVGGTSQRIITEGVFVAHL
jgi:hypothetical protein